MMERIDSVAALKRIPIGTRLKLIRNLRGPQTDQVRIFRKAGSKDITFEVVGGAQHGEHSYMPFKGVTVEPTERGFKVTGAGGGCLAEYEFIE